MLQSVPFPKEWGNKWLFLFCYFTGSLKSKEGTDILSSTFFFSREYFENHNSPVSYSSDTESDNEFHFPGCQIAYYLYRSLTHMSANSLTPNVWRHSKLDGRPEDTTELNCLRKYIFCRCTPPQNQWGFFSVLATITSEKLLLSFTFSFGAILTLLPMDKFLWHPLLGVIWHQLSSVSCGTCQKL